MSIYDDDIDDDIDDEVLALRAEVGQLRAQLAPRPKTTEEVEALNAELNRAKTQDEVMAIVRREGLANED